MPSYEEFFRRATGFQAYAWQKHLAESGFPDVLPVPTGLGKTEGVVLAWLWRARQGKGEPRHLVYCLPMRVLVTQTVERLKGYFTRLNMDVSIYELMGNLIKDEWANLPEKTWVLVGTQDQLLSRALNRGYAMSRFEWPVHFGLLNNDCRWIIDEVQLMGPGLWTTAQLDWMRRKRFGTLFDCPTTWMSATLGTAFLETTDRKAEGLHKVTALPPGLIEEDSSEEIARRLAARRPIELWLPKKSGASAPRSKKASKEAPSETDDFHKALADAAAARHAPGTLSLVICNTVEGAHRVYKMLPAHGVPKVLLTSRFRREDRTEHEKSLLDFEAKRKKALGKPLPNDPGLICVSTQVVEAGLDISAHHLWSELPPWPSVIQRLGRLNRDGRDQEARAWFWETPEAVSEGQDRARTRIGPYEAEDIHRARQLIANLIPLSQSTPFHVAVEKLRTAGMSDDLAAALQPRPEPMPRALDVHGLFSTEPDVHGGFTDISAFVRGSDPEADLTVLWRDWEGGPKKAPPAGDDLNGPPVDGASEGCPVPFYRLRETLKAAKYRAWIWNDDDAAWEEIRPDDLRPGMLVMLHREAGGYSHTLGWTGDASDRLDAVPRAGRCQALRDDEQTEFGYWAELSVHLGDTRRKAEELCKALSIPEDLRTAVVVAAELHDLGKAHPQWQGALPGTAPVAAGPWAKCPRVLAVDVASSEAQPAIAELVVRLRPGSSPLCPEHRRRNGKKGVRLRWALDKRLEQKELDRFLEIDGVLWAGHVPFRPNMRHEAASALAMWHRYRLGHAPYPALSVYLAAAHHGKVRTVFRSLTTTGDDAFGVPPQPDTLACNGESWQLDFSMVRDGAEGFWTADGFVLRSHGWTGLVSDLLGSWRQDDASCAGAVPDSEPRKLGPFRLAYLEALVRIADWRASSDPSRFIMPSEVRCDG